VDYVGTFCDNRYSISRWFGWFWKGLDDDKVEERERVI
jgi:hypothetical protein